VNLCPSLLFCASEIRFCASSLRRLALKGTAWAQAQVDTIRLKLFKIGALVRISVRRIVLQMSSAYPWKDIFTQAFHALRC
jgi:Transposase DDE domain group 1